MFTKKVFRFLSRLVRICIQSLEKMLIRAQRFFFEKSIWVLKTQNFMMILNPFKKFEKINQKNVIS